MKAFALDRLVKEKKTALQQLNPLEREAEYRKLWEEFLALEGERRRLKDKFGDQGTD